MKIAPGGNYDDDYDSEPDARQKVRGPGTALMVAGGIAALLSFALIALGFFIANEIANNAAARNDDGDVTAIVLIICGIVCVPACIVMAIGGGADASLSELGTGYGGRHPRDRVDHHAGSLQCLYPAV